MKIKLISTFSSQEEEKNQFEGFTPRIMDWQESYGSSSFSNVVSEIKKQKMVNSGYFTVCGTKHLEGVVMYKPSDIGSSRKKDALTGTISKLKRIAGKIDIFKVITSTVNPSCDGGNQYWETRMSEETPFVYIANSHLPCSHDEAKNNHIKQILSNVYKNYEYRNGEEGGIKQVLDILLAAEVYSTSSVYLTLMSANEAPSAFQEILSGFQSTNVNNNEIWIKELDYGSSNLLGLHFAAETIKTQQQNILLI